MPVTKEEEKKARGRSNKCCRRSCGFRPVGFQSRTLSLTKEEEERKSESQIPEKEEEESSRCRKSIAPPLSRGSKYVVMLFL